MNANPKIPDRKLFLWPLTAIVLGALAAMNPFYAPHIPFSLGVAAWCVDMALVLTLAAHPICARAGVLIAGLFLAVPCFVWAQPFLRALLMCFASMPFAIASAPVLFPTIIGFRARLFFLCTWGFTCEVKRRARSFNVASLVQFIAATAIFAGSFAAVITIPAAGRWLLARWLAGGIMIFAFAEMETACHKLLTGLMGLMAPAILQSPCLSASVNEFWAKRWNPAASVLFRSFCFKPLARQGVAVATFVTFILSAIGHALLVFMAIGEWNLSLACGAFFLVQPVFIMIEHSMKITRWRLAARRAWTLFVLALTSPLFVEPLLQIIGRGWVKSGNTVSANVLPPTIAALGFVVFVVVFFALASFASCPEHAPSKTALS